MMYYVHTVSSKVTQMCTINECLLDTDVLPYLKYQTQTENCAVNARLLVGVNVNHALCKTRDGGAGGGLDEGAVPHF